MDNTENTPNVLSICTGIGGLERGIERAVGEIRTVAYVEIEAFIIENLLAGMEAGLLAPTPIWANVKTFNAEPFRDKIHIITGGYPCPPFSVAGKRQGEHDPRHLWPYLFNITGTVRPFCCFFENVAGHLSLGYEEVQRSLHSIGYRVESGIFTAEEVGAPHQRERLFILAVRNDEIACSYVAGLWRQYQRRVQPEIITGNFEMAYANHNGYDGTENRESTQEGNDGNTIGKNYVFQPEGLCSESNNENLGNAAEQGLSQSGQNGQRELPKKDKRGMDNRFEQSSGNKCTAGVDLVDTCCQGLQRFVDTTNGKYNESAFVLSSNTSFDQFPARPGEQQYEWEEPRVIEPGMGCTINGYNFREDLLRAFGNGVVEQTAELAFITLLEKHATLLQK